MNRFILYSGLAHAALFMGALTYIAVDHQDARDPNVQSVVELELPTAATRDQLAVEAPQPNESQENIPHSQDSAPEANKAEVRDRKVRASLPTSPSVPRIVEKVEKVTGEKLATTLPQKHHAATQMAAAPVVTQESEESLPEMGKDVEAEAQALVAEDVDPEVQNAEKNALDEMDALAAKHLDDVKKEDSMRIAPIMSPRSDDGEGNESASKKSKGIEGASNDPSNGEAKALSEFRQKPGNKKPAYDNGDRRQGRQGTVVFMAYIEKSGEPKDFQMVSSSGHRSLDLTTLKALKSWKFVAGQEGWVEIPFRWDLVGGVQEAPSTLRRINRTAN